MVSSWAEPLLVTPTLDAQHPEAECVLGRTYGAPELRCILRSSAPGENAREAGQAVGEPAGALGTAVLSLEVDRLLV